MILDEAEGIADRVVAQMKPYCLRVQIAGSIRRRRPEVKDCEIVVVPKYETRQEPGSLFGQEIEVNLLYEDWSKTCGIQWIKPGVTEIIPWSVKPDGKYWRGLIDGQIKLDLFIAEPKQWGILLAIRTGSSDFSQALVTQGKRIGVPCVGGYLMRDGERLETPEEADVFRILNLEYVDPRNRISGANLRSRRSEK